MGGKSLIAEAEDDYIKALASKMTSLIKEHSMTNLPNQGSTSSLNQKSATTQPPWWCLKAPSMPQQDTRYHQF